MISCETLRRFDFALASSSDESDGGKVTLPFSGRPQCRFCGTPLQAVEACFVQWCRMCRCMFGRSAQQCLCAIPPSWRPWRFLRFWQRALYGSCDKWNDLAYTQFFCDRIGISFPCVLQRVDRPRPQSIRIGRLAVLHGLLTRDDVAWILRFQRAAKIHRRRCFGEIAVKVELLDSPVVARLIAAQAERRRGMVPAIVERLGISDELAGAVERRYFGLRSMNAQKARMCRFDLLMSA